MTTSAERAVTIFAPDRYHEPVAAELTAVELPVTGAIPPALAGRFFRNGPNPKPGSAASHPFVGDGMIHGVRLEGGRARWYRNRWVRTPVFERDAKLVGRFGRFDYRVAVANTNVVPHAGKILALVESSFPYAVDGELNTIGCETFGGALDAPFTAHPKVDPRTGELHAYGMELTKRRVTYVRIDAAGNLVAKRRIPVPRATMMHDMALTQRYVLFLDLPIVFSLKRGMRGEFPFRWDDRYAARIGVMRRDDPSAPVRWFEIEPCYVFHVVNAVDDGDRIVLEAARYRELWRGGPNQPFTPAKLHRWTIDLGEGTVREAALDDRAIEFPRIDERRTGAAYRYAYAIATAPQARGELYKYDLATGATQRFAAGDGRAIGEAVFVADPGGTREDDGWLLAYVYDRAEDRSALTILDASTMSTAAAIALPQRVPFGFHGNWIDDRD